MTGRARAASVALLGVALIAACSAIGLSDELNLATCSEEPPDFCESLNELSPTGDPCQRWGCDRETGFCEILPADLDYDGAPAIGCEEAGQSPDCDDSDPTVSPDVAELCDGKDNDCDGVVDEEAYALSTVDLGQVSGSEDVEDVSFTVGADDRVAVVALSGIDRRRPSAGLFPEALDDLRPAAQLSITVDGSVEPVLSDTIALAGLSTGYAVALSASTLGCERLLVAKLVEEGEELALHFDDAADLEHYGQGFPTATGGRCLDDGLVASGLSMAASVDELLLAYLVTSRDEVRSLCDDPASQPTPAPVWLSYARRRGDSSLARDEVAAAFELPEASVDSGRPALIAIDDGRWLLAVADESGALGVHLVERIFDAGDLSRRLEVTLLDTITVDEGPLGEAALAFGPDLDGGDLQLAVAARRGCRGAAGVVIQRYALSTGTTIELTTLGGPTSLEGDGDDLRRPAIAAWTGSGEWLLVAQRGDFALSGQRLDSEGSPIADPLDLLEVTGAGRPRLAETAQVTSPSGGGYLVLTHQPGEDAGFRALRITCDDR